MTKNKPAFWMALIIVTGLFIFASAYRMPNMFESEPGAGAFGGIRLHYLKILNFDFSKGIAAEEGTSHILDNFIKSAVSGTHGLLDFMHWYAYIWAYSLLGIPINEFWLLFAQAITMILALMLLCLLSEKLYDSRLLALIFIFISAQVYMRYARSFYIIPANTLMESSLLFALYYYNRGRGDLSLKAVLIVLIFLNAASGNVIKLPLFLLFIWCVNYKMNGLSILKTFKAFMLNKPLNFIYIIPALAALLCHFYVYSRIGASNLGILGWISQKMGPGVHSFSRWAFMNQALEKMLFLGYVEWWAVIIISVFYALIVLRGARKLPLLLFPVIYYLYLVNFEPHAATLGYVMVMAIGTWGMFKTVNGMKTGMKRKFSFLFAVIFSSYVFLNLTCMTVYSVVKRARPSPNYLKATGLFLRDNMTRDDKIASLLSQTDNILNEYYYGKTFFKSPVFGKEIYDYKNLSRPQSPDNPVAPSEVNREFSFYVISSQAYSDDIGYAAFFDGLIRKYSLGKVADIAQDGVIYTSVYSSRPVAYVKLDADKAALEFDRKYANIRKLFYHHHVGLASTWGYY